jgi:sporulation protein YlmC with PRC-barrel domain
MDLVRDLLDKRVVDRHGREMGRVDRLVLECGEHSAPRVVAFQIGPDALAGRVAPWFGRLVSGVERVFKVDEGRPVRIALADVLSIEDDVKVDVAFGETAAATIERALRRWVGSLPFSS